MVNPTQSNVRSTDLHRVFLQSLLSRRAETEEHMVELYKRAISACHAADDNFQPPHEANKHGARMFFKDINKILEQSELQMEMRTTKNEDTNGEDDWALINTDPGGEATHMTDYEPLQIAYFKLVADKIILNYPGNSIGSNTALFLTQQLTGTMAKSAADNLLSSFVARGWLHRSKRGRYSLAPRAILELDSWLNAGYDGVIKKCGRCSKTVLTGVICAQGDCDTHLHKTCYTMIRTIAVPKCPGCSGLFTDRNTAPLGEKAVPVAEDQFIDKGKKRKGKGKTSDGAAAGEGEEEDELDDEDGPGSDEEEEEEAPVQKKNKWKTAAGRKKGRAPSASSGEDE